MKLRHRKPIGWWHGPGFTKHNCELPVMPKRVPADLIYRCATCSQEWRWKPQA